ncbi:hypothetical protein PGT21_031870 [Puccinia graminis f. sp. tritici]|uniref:Uncharacterized protein n=1 Tax=Puccinia graminis f. sp. tritici TaxID=56615 RepID=A0A5B0NTC9_PUCGR|nr:hypothetical protein PGTUg99_032852 [Puccinia graminis f. sp. tritici]KAA1091350.1 hypothetical protein PGT21_031870 [Puccinia graminis f. sp. tritici]
MFQFITKGITEFPDSLEFSGLFRASHSSDVSCLDKRSGKQFQTASSVPPGLLELGPEDHRNIRLTYSGTSMHQLTNGTVYWLQGTVVGCRRHEMPYLMCNEMALSPEMDPLVDSESIKITGKGTIVAQSDGNQAGFDLIVQHEVGVCTAFGDHVVMVKGHFQGVLAGWDRHHDMMIVELTEATIGGTQK